MKFLMMMTLSLLPITALAGAECVEHPKEEWAAENTLKQALTEEGYTIKKFKVDGNCYEIYGRNKQGKKVEIYFDTKTLEIVKAEVEK
ncbi:MAG TPA: PepSY domain-containing protein [Methylotenera sp.]|nr:PepSY domain-containing protein [Methylotenera sp.]HPH06526.1 PepSY domain-containing protein [Methylotenera sp.]HPN01784.1 PepSY domain-containing protein [Methylotenera sp.]